MKASDTGAERVTLYQEFRLIEKSESEINTAWKGAHLLLFFLAFVFGLFCTFCFHVLMYLFDEQCVLFPKLLSLKDMRRSSTASNIILDFVADKTSAAAGGLPVDFVTTQWMDQSTCLLPTYVPLLSGICGMVWTTMFLMCSSGSRTLTGLQRPWRILPAIFVFSLALGGLCTYTSFVTQYGLQELCSKLGEFTGSSTCTYTINVATLAYERRIRGVYQATQLTMASAWLHTGCWLGAALLALARVVLLVDFRLVRVRADLQGNIEKMLERQEKHIRTDEIWIRDDGTSTLNERTTGSTTSLKVKFRNKRFNADTDEDTIQYLSRKPIYPSTSSLVFEETREMEIRNAYKNVARGHSFIVKMIDDMVDNIDRSSESIDSLESYLSQIRQFPVERQKGQRLLRSRSDSKTGSESVLSQKEAEELALAFRQDTTIEIKRQDSSPKEIISLYESVMNITPEMKATIEKRKVSEFLEKLKKSNLKTKSVQTNEVNKKSNVPKVHLLSPFISSASTATLTPDNQNIIKKIDDKFKYQDSARKNEQDSARNDKQDSGQTLKIDEALNVPFGIEPSYGLITTYSEKKVEKAVDRVSLDNKSSDLQILFETPIRVTTTSSEQPGTSTQEAEIPPKPPGGLAGHVGQAWSKLYAAVRSYVDQASQTGSDIHEFVLHPIRRPAQPADSQTSSTSMRPSVDKEMQTNVKEKQD